VENGEPMIETDAVLDKAAALKAAGAPFALVTVVRAESPTSAKPGAKAVVTADGEIEGWIGGGCAQPVVIKVVKQVLQDGQARLVRISPDRDEVVAEGIMDFNMSCHSGGTLDIFIDPVVVRPALWTGRLVASVLERSLIQGVFTGGTSGAVRAGSAAVRRGQTGFLRYYAALMIVALSGVALYFLISSS